MRSRGLKTQSLMAAGFAGFLMTAILLGTLWLHGHANGWLWTLGIVGFSLMLASLALAGAVNLQFAHPVAELIRSAERIGNGDYSSPLDFSGQHEFADLETALEQMRQKLRQTTIKSNHLTTVLDSMRDAVLVTSPDGSIRKINAAAQQLLGYKEEELVGKPMEDLLVITDPPSHPLHTLNPDTRETVIRTASGQTIPVSLSGSPIMAADPSFQGTIYVIRDITERKRAERRIRYLARFDSLTKIPNRMQFQHMLQQAIARARRADRGVALLYLDLDRFKEINDTFGHEAGDRTLEILSERLTRTLPKEAVLGRLAGDEFALFIEGLGQNDEERAQAANLARVVLSEISKAFYVQQHELFLTASIGIACCPRDAENVIDLIRHADAAMYHSKQNAGNNFAFYSPEMNAAAVERLMLKSKLRRAVERNELVMLYQPKVDLHTGMVVGAEALLRWRLPGHGDISPLAIHSAGRRNQPDFEYRRVGDESRLRGLPQMVG